ncbi:MAG: TIGR04282 family arsenosugar biosynthesis glycosyltransferase [Gemmatimonadota bacterium]|nr:TIGR04282 family arsenosugar biosynthesis glycosyltransferase [Gemmatimonadota bacterium]
MKTRLAADVGDDAALEAYRELAELAFGSAVRATAGRVVVACTPDSALEEIRAWTARTGAAPMHCVPQGAGDLGERLARAADDAFRDGAQAAVVIGTDCPALTSAMLNDAFSLLDNTDVVLGPAHDGGYYLIGLRAPRHELFAGIPWSTPRVLAMTIEAARQGDLRISLLAPLSDIDTAADWRAWRAWRALTES